MYMYIFLYIYDMYIYIYVYDMYIYIYMIWYTWYIDMYALVESMKILVKSNLIVKPAGPAEVQVGVWPDGNERFVYLE